jgi:long-chain fatty acid transport protein
MFERLVARCAAVLLVASAAAAPAGAAGFGIFEQGSRAMGMGMAFTAQADDPSALFYNAGGLAFFDETEFAVGFTHIRSTEAEFQRAGSSTVEEQETLAEFPPHAYWIQPINEAFRFGLGIESPFGLVTEWQNPDDFSGRFLSTRAALRAIDVNPSIGWRVTPKLGLGFGAIARFSDVEYDRHVPVTIPPFGTFDVGRVALESDMESGYGFNFGVLHRYNDSFSWGFSYRSKVEVEYGGSARFTQIPTGIPPIDAAVRAQIPFDQDLDVETEIEFPDMASLGFNVALTARTRMEVDVNWTGWSSFDELPVTFVGIPPLSSTIPQGWDDAMNYRLGFQWTAPLGDEWRFGYVFDETPQPDEAVSPLLPDADRNGFSVGYGHQFNATRLDLAVMYLPFDERTTSTQHNGLNGTYNTTAWLFGATLGF